MRREAQVNADSDHKAREEADTINQADSLIFQTEKQLKEFGDKIPADKKPPIEDALAELKKAHADKDVSACKSAIEKLNQVFSAASAEMYNTTNAADAGANKESDAGQSTSSKTDGEVTDVDFEEVKENK